MHFGQKSGQSIFTYQNKTDPPPDDGICYLFLALEAPQRVGIPSHRTDSSHESKRHGFNVTGSNLGIIAYAKLEVLFKSRGAQLIFPDLIFEN